MADELDTAVAKLSQVLDGYLAKIKAAVWQESYLDDSAHQGAGRADLVVGDTSRRTEKIAGLVEQVGKLSAAAADAKTELVRIRTYVARIEAKVDALSKPQA